MSRGSNSDANPDLKSPDLECDGVMKGGITSGIVYPGALYELADKFKDQGLVVIGVCHPRGADKMEATAKVRPSAPMNAGSLARTRSSQKSRPPIRLSGR